MDTSGLVRALRRYSGDVDCAATDAGYSTAQTVAARTRGNVPHVSGRLAASVEAVRESKGARVSMSTPYAAWIEYGGSRGRPYDAEGR